MKELAERKPSVSFRYAGELIKYTRKKLGYSQLDLARKAKMSQSGLSKIESGVNAMPRKILQISDILKLDQKQVMSLEEKTNKSSDSSLSTLDKMKQQFPNWRDLMIEALQNHQI